jgi:hypothetical protein
LEELTHLIKETLLGVECLVVVVDVTDFGSILLLKPPILKKDEVLE